MRDSYFSYQIPTGGDALMRLDYAAIAPVATKALAGVNAALLRAGLDQRLMVLLFLRVSQTNGCAYCVDLHARDYCTAKQ
jgi:alkylhydroperoxidase family enzyme